MSDNYFEYPIWTRSIELDQEIREYKIDITQFLVFFEYYLNELTWQDKAVTKEAAINLISTNEGLDIQVVSIDFSENEVDQKYQEYISFFAEPALLNKIISNLKSSSAEHSEEGLIAEEFMHKLIKMKREIKSLQNSLSNSANDPSQNEDPKVLKEEIKSLKNKILTSLTETEILTKDKQYFQEIIKNFSNQNISLISQKISQQNNINTSSMTQQNFQNSNINNSGNMNFGQNYSEMVSNSRQKIVEMVKPTDDSEDKLIQIQGYLLEILELITTNQEIPEIQKEVAIKAVNHITENSEHNANLDDKKTGIIQTALETISSIFNGVSSTVSNLETVKNLAGIFGLKI